MAAQNRWTREQLLVAFYLYCQMPFGQFSQSNPQIKRYSKLLGRSPSALAMKLCNIASLDPAIINSGRKGLQGASASDRAMWEEMNSDWEAFSANSYQAVTQLDSSQELTQELDKELEESANIQKDRINFEGADRMVVTKARVGQHLFRNSVLSAYDFRCCISGLSHPKFLIASHIVPWRSDTANRLNPRNGLCLSVLHDRAFDQGLITLTDELEVQVSPALKSGADDFMKSSLIAFEGKQISVPGKFEPLQEFLKHHQQQIFIQ